MKNVLFVNTVACLTLIGLMAQPTSAGFLFDSILVVADTAIKGMASIAKPFVNIVEKYRPPRPKPVPVQDDEEQPTVDVPWTDDDDVIPAVEEEPKVDEVQPVETEPAKNATVNGGGDGDAEPPQKTGEVPPAEPPVASNPPAEAPAAAEIPVEPAAAADPPVEPAAAADPPADPPAEAAAAAEQTTQ